MREALRERGRLLAIAPHLVRSARFVLPHVRAVRPAWLVRAGLLLYDVLAGRQGLERSGQIKLQTSPLGLPLRPQLTRGFIYSDCIVDDSRLTILNARDAAERGADIRIGHRFLGAQREQSLWRAQITHMADRQPYCVSARALVNATGPWVADALWSRVGSADRTTTQLVKGSHIVVPRLYEGAQCYVLQNADRRIVFVIPYQDDFTLIGTTDVAWSGPPGPVEASPEEIEYLCATVNDYFQRPVSAAHVQWTYSGLRPLYDNDAADAAALSRDYVLHLDASNEAMPLLTVLGGKITTYRRLAEHALMKLQPWFPGLRAPWTASRALPGGDLPGGFASFLADVQRRWPFLGPERALRMVRAYGTRIEAVIGEAHCPSDLGEEFGAGLTRSEVDYLVREEWARTADDVLWRYSKLGLRISCAAAARLETYLRESAVQERDASQPNARRGPRHE